MAEKMSQTMRIDLIPSVPKEPVKGKRKQVIVATPTRSHRPVRPAPPPAAAGKESRYQELLQSLYDAALITDLQGRIVDGNVRAIEFLLYSRDEIRALTIFDVISGTDESLIRTLLENLKNERFTLIEAYCIRKDSSFFPAEIAVNKLEIGDVHLCFFIRDITVRRQQQEMLRTEHTAIQNARDGIVVVDMDSLVEYANPAVARMWGFRDASELVGRDVRSFFVDAGSVEKMIQATSSEQNWTGEMKAKRHDGQAAAFDVQISAACNRNSDGEPVGFVFSFVDVTDLKRAEEALRDAERHRVMLESLGAACHHLGQPATVVLANLGIIERKMLGGDPLLKELVQSSIDAAETLGEILHRLNAVNEYKTTQYLDRGEGADSAENRILDI